MVLPTLPRGLMKNCALRDVPAACQSFGYPWQMTTNLANTDFMHSQYRWMFHLRNICCTQSPLHVNDVTAPDTASALSATELEMVTEHQTLIADDLSASHKPSIPVQERQPCKLISIQALPSGRLMSIIPADVKRYERNIRMKMVEPKRLDITPGDNKMWSVCMFTIISSQYMHSGRSKMDDVTSCIPKAVELIIATRNVFTDVALRRGKIDSRRLLTAVHVSIAHVMKKLEVSARINEETKLVLEVDVGK
ncbi:hypothetical protein K503DRAFT_554834 [Rhizopogon vinicolor AM-OR11-026]|uniref:Uncharacterized protein n=1 Tax=Rhizopogon vinicolor AM-OR11-026 TaxID=1314800 RepID=A0A1B7N849_9AGAM|nr:hypothetical protein K503DRAFT_554834 [Rhizopogon vinicolor AM-OR11-026]